MTLPALVAPAGTPPFLAAGHSHAESEVYGDVDFTVGHSRKRRLWVGTDRVVGVEWTLTAAQMAAVDAWFEGSLLAGEREFAARVAAQGPGLLWWTAQWVEPYEATPLDGGRWHIVGKLLLTGIGYSAGPVLPKLAIEFNAALTGTATFLVSSKLATEFIARLTKSLSLAVEFVAALELEVGNYELREDGSFELREDGSIELRE